MFLKETKKFMDYFEGFFNAIDNLEPEYEYKQALKYIIEFNGYMDMLAAASPQRFHHVYEWDQIGVDSARLFQLNATHTGPVTTINYEFLPSKTPNRQGYIFVDKAEIMEAGQEVVSSPERPAMIGEDTWRVGPFTIQHPGGTETVGAFDSAFNAFFLAKGGRVYRGGMTITPSSMTKNGGYHDGKRLYDSIIFE